MKCTYCESRFVIISDLEEHERSCPKSPTAGLRVILDQVRAEVNRSEKWPPMNSAHEGYAIILEELDELWTHVKTNQNRRDLDGMREEAVQAAAMCVKFIRDVCDGGRGRV